MARYDDYGPYVSVAERRKKALREAEKRAKKGQKLSPVEIRATGRKLTTTFWGNAWCDHLETHSDYANRLPRGRTYVRNGSVIDLQIAPKRVTALVQGSALYSVTVTIGALAPPRWKAIVGACAGAIDSLVELLQGKLSHAVMTVVTHRQSGLFPAPQQIDMACSCPDGARMCKHVAAVLYGVGARLDDQPELLFVLRDVDHLALIAGAGAKAAMPRSATKSEKTKRKAIAIADGDLANVFGIEMEMETGTAKAKASRGTTSRAPKKAPKKKTAAPLAKKVPRRP